MESLGYARGNEAVIRVKDGDERVDLAQPDAADDEEPLPLADDGVHHEVEDGRGDEPALGDAAPSLEGEPKTPGSLTD